MFELFLIYKWTLLAALTMAPALSLIGAQLAARDQAMQALVLSQASALGVVLGLAALIASGHPAEGFAIFPALVAILCGAIAFLGLEKLVPKTMPSRNSFYVTAFAGFLALTFLVTSVTPQLESHMASVYFGDLAVAGESESKLAAFVALIALGLLAARWRVFTNDSFSLAMFGSMPAARRQRGWLFLLLSLGTIGLSIQLMGLLFSLSCLFIPTSFLARRGSNLKRHTIEISLASVLSCLVGFLISLRYSNLPTVPCIVISLLLITALCRWVEGLRRS